MSKSHRVWYRRVFPTAHKLLLKRRLKSLFGEVRGDVLVVGGGREPYKQLLVAAESVLITDIGPEHEGLDQFADAHDLPFENESFDSVLAIEVFEHLQDPVVAAQEMHRVMKQDAYGLVTVPFMFHVHGDPNDYCRFTRSGLRTLFKGFRSVSVSEFGGRIHVVSDILTTATRLFAGLRIVNQFLVLWPFCRSSEDCPSGYVIEFRK